MWAIREASRCHVAGKKTILIVEDEPEIGELIRFHAEREGYEADVIASGKTALEAIRRRPPDLIILDLMLPDVDGLEVCRQVRWDETTRHVPIIIASARGEETYIVTGLELGADDYVTKPFSPKVLMARVRSLLRRLDASQHSRGQGQANLARAAGDRLVLDRDQRTVAVDGAVVEFTRCEFEILDCLMSKPGFVRTRDQIIAAIHGDEMVQTSRTVDVHLASIRRKLGALSDLVQTVRGVGYRLDESIVDDGEE
ncbi:MAG: DNA-binding response regulator [Planctomycetes bacterium]|nr:DNA-binding response regulator [Planctomycetota bacterium]NOG54726.1 response regulator transcription factor [Planctomycetota bacterium]